MKYVILVNRGRCEGILSPLSCMRVSGENPVVCSQYGAVHQMEYRPLSH